MRFARAIAYTFPLAPDAMADNSKEESDWKHREENRIYEWVRRIRVADVTYRKAKSGQK